LFVPSDGQYGSYCGPEEGLKEIGNSNGEGLRYPLTFAMQLSLDVVSFK
jgi:hypothetical protein